MASLLETLKQAANAVWQKAWEAVEYVGKPILDTYNSAMNAKTSAWETVWEALSKAPERIVQGLSSDYNKKWLVWTVWDVALWKSWDLIKSWYSTAAKTVLTPFYGDLDNPELQKQREDYIGKINGKNADLAKWIFSVALKLPIFNIWAWNALDEMAAWKKSNLVRDIWQWWAQIAWIYGLLVSPIAWTIANELINETGTWEYIQKWMDKAKKYLVEEKWMDEWTADWTVELLKSMSDIAFSYIWVKSWKWVTNKLWGKSLLSKAAWLTTEWAVQSIPDIWMAAYGVISDEKWNGEWVKWKDVWTLMAAWVLPSVAWWEWVHPKKKWGLVIEETSWLPPKKETPIKQEPIVKPSKAEQAIPETEKMIQDKAIADAMLAQKEAEWVSQSTTVKKWQPKEVLDAFKAYKEAKKAAWESYITDPNEFARTIYGKKEKTLKKSLLNTVKEATKAVQQEAVVTPEISLWQVPSVPDVKTKPQPKSIVTWISRKSKTNANVSLDLEKAKKWIGIQNVSNPAKAEPSKIPEPMIRPDYETWYVDKKAADLYVTAKEIPQWTKPFWEQTKATQIYTILKDKTAPQKEIILKFFSDRTDPEFKNLKSDIERARYIDSKLFPQDTWVAWYENRSFRADAIKKALSEYVTRYEREFKTAPKPKVWESEVVWSQYASTRYKDTKAWNPEVTKKWKAVTTWRKTTSQVLMDIIRSKIEWKVDDIDAVMNKFFEFATKSKTVASHIKSIANRMATGKYDDKFEQKLTTKAYNVAFDKFVANHPEIFKKKVETTVNPDKKLTKWEKFVQKTVAQADKQIKKEKETQAKAEKTKEVFKKTIKSVKDKVKQVKEIKTSTETRQKDSNALEDLKTKVSWMNNLEKLTKKLANTQWADRKAVVQARIDELSGTKTKKQEKAPAVKIVKEVTTEKSQKNATSKLKERAKKEKITVVNEKIPEESLPSYETPTEWEVTTKGKKVKTEKAKTDIGSAWKVIENQRIDKWVSMDLAPWTKIMSWLGWKMLNADTMLNNIRMFKDGKFIGTFSKFIQAAKNTWKQVANKIAHDFWLKNLVHEWLSSKNLDSNYNNIIWNAAEIMKWGRTPNDKFQITDKNVNLAIESMKDADSLDMSWTFWHEFNHSRLSKLMQLDYIYQTIKWDAKKVKQYFSDEFVNLFNKIDTVNQEMYKKLWEYLVSTWVMEKFELLDDYLHFVMIKNWRERLARDIWDKANDYFTTSDWRVFDSFLEMAAHLKTVNKHNTWKQIIPLKSIKDLSSILKEKSTGVDFYRFNSSIAQGLDYARNFWEVQKLKTIFDAFDNLDKTTNTDVSKYTEGMYSSNLLDNVLENAINISSESQSGWKKNLVDKPVSLWVKAVMIWGLDSILQAATSWAFRMVMLWRNPLSMISYFNKKVTPETKNTLQQYWITQHFELGWIKGIDTSKMVSFFWGTPVENAQKAAVAKPIMRDVVMAAWWMDKVTSDLVKKGDINAITKEFDRVMTESDVSTRTKIMDTIYDATNYIWNMTSAARSRITPLRRLWFTALKTFDSNLVGQVYQNMQKVYVKLKEWWDKTKKEVWGKVISLGIAGEIAKIAWPAIAYYAIVQAMSAQWESEEDKKILEEQWKDLANKFIGNPFVSMYDYIGNQISNIWNLPAAAAIELIRTLHAMYELPGLDNKSKVAMNNLLTFLGKQTQLWQNINMATKVATNKTLLEHASEAMWTASRENQTKALNATWFGTESRWEALGKILWINQDSATQKFIYKEIEKAKNWEQDPINNYFMSNYNNASRAWKDSIANLPWMVDSATKQTYIDNIVKQNYAATVLQHRDWNETLWDFLAKNWLEWQDFENNFRQWELKNMSSMRSTNKDMEKFIKDAMIFNQLEWNTFSEKLNDMQKKNPVLFNNLISAVAKTKMQLDKWEFETNPRLALEALQRNFQSDTAIDAAVNAVTWDAANTTAISEAIRFALSEARDPKKWRETLDRMEKLMKIANDNSQYTNWIVRSMALSTMQLQWILSDLEKGWYRNFSTDYPELSETIKNALQYRWETEWKWSSSELPISSWDKSDHESLLKLLSNQTTWIAPKPQKIWKNLLEIKLQKPVKPQKLLSESPVPQSWSLLAEVLKNRSVRP